MNRSPFKFQRRKADLGIKSFASTHLEVVYIRVWRLEPRAQFHR